MWLSVGIAFYYHLVVGIVYIETKFTTQVEGENWGRES